MSSAANSAYVPLFVRLENGATAIAGRFSDERMENWTVIRWLSHKIDRPPSAIAQIAFLSMLMFLLLEFYGLSGVLTNMLGLVPGVYITSKYFSTESLAPAPLTPGFRMKKEIENQRKDRFRRILDYWLIYSSTFVFENVFGEDEVLGLIPLWWAVKACGIMWALGNFSGEKLEMHKPKPLRLRPRPKGSQKTELAKEPSPEPELLGSAALLDRHAKASQQTVDNDDKAQQSRPQVNQGEARTVVDTSLPLRARPKHDDDQPGEIQVHPTSERNMGRFAHRSDAVISARSETGETQSTESESEHSPPFSLSDGEDNDSSPESESDNESEPKSLLDADDESGSQSDDSDDSNDFAILPPGSPLDELALRGMPTKHRQMDDIELDEEYKFAPSESMDLDVSLKLEVSQTTSPQNVSTEKEVEEFVAEAKEGGVTRLTLDELLALEGEGEMEEGEVSVALRGERVSHTADEEGESRGGTKPLKVAPEIHEAKNREKGVAS